MQYLADDAPLLPSIPDAYSQFLLSRSSLYHTSRCSVAFPHLLVLEAMLFGSLLFSDCLLILLCSRFCQSFFCVSSRNASNFSISKVSGNHLFLIMNVGFPSILVIAEFIVPTGSIFHAQKQLAVLIQFMNEKFTLSLSGFTIGVRSESGIDHLLILLHKVCPGLKIGLARRHRPLEEL